MPRICSRPTPSLIAVRRGSYLRNYAYRFIELCSPALPEAGVRAAVMADAQSVDAMVRRAAAVQPWRSKGNALSREEVKRTG